MKIRPNVEPLEVRELLAYSSPALLKDINPGSSSASSTPTELVHVNDTAFFSAFNSQSDALWKSDGTFAGTSLVKDVAPRGLTNVNGTLYFASSASLWKSNGTAAGTVEVARPNPGGPSEIYQLTAVGNLVYFEANDGTHGRELWKSDGSAAGTQMVRDLNPNSADADLAGLTNVNGTLLFRANNGATGNELFKSDGTAAGTVLVEDISPGAASGVSAAASTIANLGGTLFFQANDGTGGDELWKSDGTPAGTVRVKDINPGAVGSSVGGFANVLGTLYFSADDGSAGTELWKSDGSAAGTVRVKDINPGSVGSSPAQLTAVGATAFFTAADAAGTELWASDGTPAGTRLVLELSPGSDHTNFGQLAAVNDLLFFAAGPATSAGTELWRSDGTAFGTSLSGDIDPGFFGSGPSQLTNVHGTLFFSANDGFTGRELWAVGPQTLAPISLNPQGDSSPIAVTALGERAFFAANDGSTGTELWVRDGTTPPRRVKDIRPGSGAALEGSYMRSLAEVGGVLFFSANDGTTGKELWRSDGTEAGTVLVENISVGSASSTPRNLTNVSGTLFFTVSGGIGTIDLWKSDGTAAGTSLVKNFQGFAGGPNQRYLANVNGVLYFMGNDGTSGYELWRSDGTAAGTTLVADIGSGSQSSNPGDLVNVNGVLYFTATDATAGRELFKSDGTAAGTVLVKDIFPGSNGSVPLNSANVNGILFFGASFNFERELWKSDGTAAGTVLVKEGQNVPLDPRHLANVGGVLYFAGDEDPIGRDIWKSDGTAAGTTRVVDLNRIVSVGSGSSPSNPTSLANVAGDLYFAANDGLNGIELWRLPTVDLAPVGDRVVPASQDTTVLKLDAFVRSGRPATYSVQVGSEASAYDALYGLHFSGNYYLNSAGAGEKWFLGSGGASDWYFIKPNGELVHWDFVTASATGELIARLDPIYHEKPELLHDAAPVVAQEYQAYDLDTSLGLSFTGTYYENYGGQGEKWFLGTGNKYYFIKPNGQLLRWNNVLNQATGTLIATLPAIYHEKPTWLHDALPEQLPFTLKQSLGLFFTGNYLLNYGGMNEKWLRGTGNNVWYFIKPNGDFVKWNGVANQATGRLLATLDPLYYADPARLYNVQPDFAALAFDRSLGLRSTTTYSENYGGQGEKWVLGNGGIYYFVKPNGDFHQWDGTANQATGPKLATLEPLYHEVLTLLHDVLPLTVAATIQQQYNPRFTGDLLVNTFGQGEKWLKGSGSTWYLTKPNGEFLRWNGVNGQVAGKLLARLNPIHHARLDLLYDTPSALSSHELAQVVDTTYGLNFKGSYSTNVYGQGEKWFLSTDGSYYFIKPNGELFQWNGVVGQTSGTLVAKLNAFYHQRPELLDSASAETQSFVLDQALGLFLLNGYQQNYGGQQEKWIRGGAFWYFIKPSGELYRWDGTANQATGKLLARLDSVYYRDPTLLHEAKRNPFKVGLSGNVVTVDPSTGYRGTIGLLLTASDGVNSSSEVVTVDAVS